MNSMPNATLVPIHVMSGRERLIAIIEENTNKVVARNMITGETYLLKVTREGIMGLPLDDEFMFTNDMYFVEFTPAPARVLH